MAVSKENRRKRRNEFDGVTKKAEPKTVKTVNGELPRESGSRPTNEAGLDEWLAENGNTAVGRELDNWDYGMLTADDKGNMKIDRENVKAAAKQFVAESQDFQYGKDYLVNLAREQAEANGVKVKTKEEAEAIYNNSYAARADAILLAADVGNVKLTEAQRRRLEAARDGKALDTTYNERRKEAGSLQNAVSRNAPKLSGSDLDRARENFREWVQRDDRYERAG